MFTFASAGTLAIVIAGCQRVGVAPSPPPGAADACPAPAVRTAGWEIVADSAGVTYRLPPGFNERPPGDLPFRDFTYSDELRGRVSIGFSPSREHYGSFLRVPSPSMHEMSQCLESINGRDVLLQSWRTEGGSFRQGRRYDLFEMLALVPVQPMLTLFVTGQSEDPAFQQVLLAIARTVEVGTR
jgi:hypothetical protein